MSEKHKHVSSGSSQTSNSSSAITAHVTNSSSQNTSDECSLTFDMPTLLADQGMHHPHHHMHAHPHHAPPTINKIPPPPTEPAPPQPPPPDCPPPPGPGDAAHPFGELNLADPSPGGSSDDDCLRIPPIDARPNSAPAVIQPKLADAQAPPGLLHTEVDTFLSALRSSDAGAALPSAVAGALDFNFDASADEKADEFNSFVSLNLEQELRRDAEVRGRSLSPKRSNAFDLMGFPEDRIAGECHDDAAPAQNTPPGQSTSPHARSPHASLTDRIAPLTRLPEAAVARKEEDLSKLRMQQEILANQLRSLQEQEWAILERRPSPDTGATAAAAASVMSHSAGITPASTHSLLSTPPRGETSQPARRGYTTTNQASDVFSNSTPPSSFATPQSTPIPFPHNQMGTPPRGEGQHGGKGAGSSSSVLLTPHMLDLKSAPPGHRLDAFYGQVGMVAKDQHGCRFLQKLCEDGNTREIGLIFDEISPLTGEMMVDPFGNYLMQKLCEHCNEQQRTVLITKVAAEIPHVASEMHGTRAVQKVVEQLRTPKQVAIMRSALSKHTVQMVKDLNGNHVIQKCLQKFDEQDKQFIYDTVSMQLCDVAMHRHGCCVLQRCIDYGSFEQKMQLVSEIVKHALQLVQDPFGNYVVQYVLDMHVESVTLSIIQNFSGSLCELAMNKFSSNVIEKCIKLAGAEVRAIVLTEMCDPHVLPRMLQDPFANYVVQTALNNATQEEFATLSAAIRPYLHTIKNTPHGKKIEMKLNRKPDAGGHDRDRDGRGKGRAGGRGGNPRGGKGGERDHRDRQHGGVHGDRLGGGGGGMHGGGGGSGSTSWGQWGQSVHPGWGGGNNTSHSSSSYDSAHQGHRGGRSAQRSGGGGGWGQHAHTGPSVGGGGFGASLRPDAPAYQPQRQAPPTAAHW